MLSQKIAGFTPEALLKKYQEELFGDFLPFADQHLVDHAYGGFKCNTDREGNNITTTKRTWFDGRGVWVYAYLYNNFGQDEKHLQVAKKTVDLLMRVKSLDDKLWPWAYDQTGEDLKEREADIYGNLFVAEGLIEYAKAVEDPAIFAKAKSIILDVVSIYDSPDYLYSFEFKPDLPIIKMPRVLGHWMILLRLSSSFLKHQHDKDLEILAGRCVDALLNKHLQPEFNLMVEFLERDLSLPEGNLNQFVYIGHAIEALWMIMDEAIRMKDDELFNKTALLFKRHVEVAWDDVYGGIFHGLENVNENKWQLEKVLWAQQEVLVGLVLLIAHNNDNWAYQWFDKAYHHVINTYPLKKHGYRLWNIGGDRKMTFHQYGNRIENYHTPRHLMLNTQRLEEMIRAKSGIRK